LLEARNPSNPAVVSEIDGVVSFGKIKEVTVRLLSNLNLVTLENTWLNYQILVQENDFVRGVPLSDGAITPDDILRIKDQQLFNSIW
jgi:DNA-directed RNA polymerase subunit beta'